MTDATPHALWKGFCRCMEHKAFVRRFGDGYGKRFDSFAIFEISQAQHESMTASIFSDGEAAPPFPFPKIVLIFPNFLLAIEQPEMDLDAGVLQYDATIYYVRGETPAPSQTPQMDEAMQSVVKTAVQRSEEIAMARIRLDVERSAQAREPVAEVSEFRIQIHYPDEVIDYADGTSFSSRIDNNTQMIRSSGNTELIAKLDSVLEETRRIEAKMLEALREHLRVCLILGILSIVWINRPKHYIVEQSAEIIRNPGKGDRDRVRRLAERSRHIVIEHDEIRRRWTDHHGTHGSPMPHLRRGHYKTLRSERYKNMRGKVIWVSPCHVGGECVEWREGAVSYKVIG